MTSTALESRGGGGNRYVSAPNPSGLADVLEIILDKGLVIDIYVRVSLVGIELLTIDARIVIASVDTYLRFAEAVGRLDLGESQPSTLTDLFGDTTEKVAKGKTSGVLAAGKEKFQETFGSDDDEEEEEKSREKVKKGRRE
jgi:gas vesicle structural protein